MEGRRLMSQSLSQIFVHIAFSTKDRFPFLDESVSEELFKYIAGVCRNSDCPVIQVGGHRDHVHVLCGLSRTISPANLIREIKTASSKWIKSFGGAYEKFFWQDGYGIFSVSPLQTAAVSDYIKNQKDHHKTRSFQDEFKAFLKKYNVKYDEKYVWA